VQNHFSCIGTAGRLDSTTNGDPFREQKLTHVSTGRFGIRCQGGGSAGRAAREISKDNGDTP